MSIPVPYIPDFQNFAIDYFVAFVVSALLAIMVNAEGQAFAATALGDTQNSKDRFHFNAFLHLSIWGGICFFLAGFGWPRKMEIDVSRFSRPRLFTILVRLTGPMSNFLLAGIAGSALWILTAYGVEDRVFTIVLIVNATMAVYSLIPIPPLAGFSVLSVFLPEQNRFLQYFRTAGPFLLISIFLLERITGRPLLSHWMDPFVHSVYRYITG